MRRRLYRKREVKEYLMVFWTWQSLYEDLQKRIPRIEFICCIPDYLNNYQFINPEKMVPKYFDDLMTEAKCDQRIADLFTQGSHHRNISIVYLTQNVFPQGKVCRDITLNTQYLVLLNNKIGSHQVATLARRIYPSTSAAFIRKFEDYMAQPYGCLIVDRNSITWNRTDYKWIYLTPSINRLQMRRICLMMTMLAACSLDFICSLSPSSKWRKLRDKCSKPDIWNRSVESLDYICLLSPPSKQRKLGDERSKMFLKGILWKQRMHQRTETRVCIFSKPD